MSFCFPANFRACGGVLSTAIGSVVVTWHAIAVIDSVTNLRTGHGTGSGCSITPAAIDTNGAADCHRGNTAVLLLWRDTAHFCTRSTPTNHSAIDSPAHPNDPDTASIDYAAYLPDRIA